MSDSNDADDGDGADDLTRLGESDLPALLGHLYRGELSRAVAWRDRLDRTTNWAVTVMAALLTFVFSAPNNPHYLLLIGMLTVALFHLVETRRYRTYDVWRSRVRLLEENLFATAVDPDGSVEYDPWQHELGEDLRRPAVKTPFAEAYSRRFRRIYLPLSIVLLAAWVARITVFAPGSDPVSAAAIVAVPGSVVIAVVALTHLLAGAIAFWPRERKAMGELYDRGKEGEWKEE